MEEYAKLGINTKGRTSGIMKTVCPKCSHTRKNKTEPCLSLNISEGLYNCHHCGWAGSTKKTTKYEKTNYVIPKYNNTKLSENVFEYFKSRGISESTILKHKVSCEKSFIPKNGKEVECIVWNYFRDGEIVNKKYRSSSKGFKLEKGAELLLYNYDSITNDYVIFTEGEFDCMSYDEAGLHSVVSVPNGASKGDNKLSFLEKCYEKFANVKKIYLAIDNDEAGASLVQELSRRLGKEKCYKVSYPDDLNDPNDVLRLLGREALKETIDLAEPFPIEGVITGNDVRDDIHRLYLSGIERGEELGELGVNFCKMCTFKTSMLYTITGIPSHGKSTMINYWEVLLAATKGWKFAIFSPEHYPLEYFIYKYAEMLVGMPFFEGQNPRMNKMTLDKAIDFVNEHFYFIRPEGEQFTLDKILEVGRQLVFRYGVRGFTIDPWNTVEHDFKGLTETQYIEKALNKLTIYKQVNDLCIFLIAHPTKIRKTEGVFDVPSLYDISGSSNFYNKTDFGITIYRNFLTGFTELYVQKVKFKNLGTIDWTRFSYDVLTNRYSPENEDYFRGSLLPEPAQSNLPF